MKSTSPTEDPTVSLPADPGVPSAAGEPPKPELQAPVGTAARDRCSSCASPVAPDQRYCVQCGQRLAQARPPFMGTRPESAAAPPPPKRSRFGMTPNSTLLAAIGTLLLAMGVGVLIGRSGQSSTPQHTVTPILTVPSSGSTGTSSGAPASTGTPGSGSKASSKPTAGTSASEGTKAAAPKPTPAASPPPNPTVKLGQKGSGKGYQHGKFTGHFFGGENEEEAGEEASSGGGKSSKK